MRQKIHKAIRAKQCIRSRAPKDKGRRYNKGKDTFWTPKLLQSRPQWLCPTTVHTAPEFVSAQLFAQDSGRVIALDTCSDVSIGRVDILKNVRLVQAAVLAEGCGGRHLFEMEGELSLVNDVEITVFAVNKGDLPPNSRALLGNPHLKQLCVSLDFAQNHPYCHLGDAIDYGRTLVFPRTLLRPMTPALALRHLSGCFAVVPSFCWVSLSRYFLKPIPSSVFLHL